MLLLGFPLGLFQSGIVSGMGVGLTSAPFGLAVSIGVWAACSYLLVFAVALFLPETRNKELEVYV